MDAPPVIQVENLRKSYGSTLAVEDVSLTVHRGEIVGILGPNGAGKTTTVECLAGLRSRDGGRVEVLGLDPERDRAALRERLGMQLQESELPARIRVHEAVELYASFYADPADTEALIDDLGLSARRNALFRELSGGQKQRLSVALALVGNPEVAVLDELTTGLDPQARRDTWDLIRRVRDRGVTILLVTHLMEEAERLCDRIVLIDSGRVAATGTPAELAALSVGERVLRFRAPEHGVAEVLALVPGVGAVHGPDETSRYEVHGGDELVQDVMVALDRAGARAHDVALERGSLEDAFLTLTGKDGARRGSRGAGADAGAQLTRSEA
jgi:ABC-2 type transport system ATP-binding protein